MKSLQLFWTQYADFSRRSDRKEFWISQVWHLLFTSPFWIYQLVLFFSNSKSEEEVIPLTGMDVSTWFSIFFLLYLYLIFVPQQAVVVRRLRDAGFHWSLIFLFLGPILLYLLSPISIFLVLALAGLLCLACLLLLPSARLAQQDQNASQEFDSVGPEVSSPSVPSHLMDPNSFSAIPQIVSAPPTPLEKAPLEKKMESEQTQHQFREWNEVPSEHAGFTNN
ncbi:DUF805 domain-containing protein [Streptococcus sp. DFI.7.26]|uniref:DUF805 domain-containing protein n=1 Tax=Streptococcus sp. DFI.7.26 TaxID=2916965 RepID=UPI001EE84033|nr:DUF805 domain-containing protein [Streptococcus sp. DFI.7.26]MCG5641338.1 DUF805 domain-containing protein [Streptococcus sp. DFI.7.26]